MESQAQPPADNTITRLLATVARPELDSVQPTTRSSQIGPIMGLLPSERIWTQRETFGWVADRLESSTRLKTAKSVVSPPPDLLGPAVESLRFRGYCPELREMYAKLLETSMDAQTAKFAHPGFVRVIEHLTPDEARLLAWMAKMKEKKPFFVDVYTGSGSQQIYHLRKFTLLGIDAACTYPELINSYVNNFTTLGLFEIFGLGTMGPRMLIDPRVADDPHYRRTIAELANEHPVTVGSSLLSTEFGKRFLAACVIGGESALEMTSG